MSVVTDVISLTAIDDRGIGSVQEWLKSFTQHNEPMVEVGGNAGGDKGFQADIWTGAYNAFNTDGFLKQIEVADWVYRDSVSVLIKEEHEDRFTKYDLHDGFQTDSLSVGEFILVLEQNQYAFTATNLRTDFDCSTFDYSTQDELYFYEGDAISIEELADTLREFLSRSIAATSATICKTHTNGPLTKTEVINSFR